MSQWWEGTNTQSCNQRDRPVGSCKTERWQICEPFSIYPSINCLFQHTLSSLPNSNNLTLPEHWLWVRPCPKSFMWINSVNPHTNPVGRVPEVKERAGIWTQKFDSKAPVPMRATTYFSAQALQSVLLTGAFTSLCYEPSFTSLSPWILTASCPEYSLSLLHFHYNFHPHFSLRLAHGHLL